MSFFPNKKIWRLFGYFFLLTVSLIILFWSLVSTGFENLKSDLRNNNLRNVPIEYTKEITNGDVIKIIYKVPESNVLPGDFRYFIKKFRDKLWVLLSRTPKEKAEIYLLMADKRMFETTELIKNQKSENLILKTLDNSIYNLMEAKKNLLEEKKKDPYFFRIDQQINQAGLAYEDIVKSLNYKNETINKIINELEIWNEKNKEYK